MKKTSVAKRVKGLGLAPELIDFMKSLGWNRLKLVLTVFHADSYQSFDIDLFSEKGREDQIQRQHLPEPLCQKIDQVMDEFKSVEKLIIFVEKSGDIVVRSFSKNDLRKRSSEQLHRVKPEVSTMALKRKTNLSKEPFGQILAFLIGLLCGTRRIYSDKANVHRKLEGATNSKE